MREHFCVEVPWIKMFWNHCYELQIIHTCFLHPVFVLHTQAILKRSLKHTCSILPLMKRGHTNNLEFFLSNIGKIYMNG